MDPGSITVVLTALAAATAAGATHGVQCAANEVVGDAYRALRKRLARLWGEGSEADKAVDLYEREPQIGEADLARHLALINEKDAIELESMAAEILACLPEQARSYSMALLNNKGVQVNRHSPEAIQVNYFN